MAKFVLLVSLKHLKACYEVQHVGERIARLEQAIEDRQFSIERHHASPHCMRAKAVQERSDYIRKRVTRAPILVDVPEHSADHIRIAAWIS